MFDVNTKTWVNAETTTDENGKYQITSFLPGEYYAKFIYPNGQDYKSTTYNYDKVNSGFDVNNPDREIGTLIEPTDVNYSECKRYLGRRNNTRNKKLCKWSIFRKNRCCKSK